MKKILLSIGVVFLLLVISLAVILISAYHDIKQVEDGIVLNNKVITVKDSIVNIFLIQINKKNAIIVDAGFSADAKPILNALSKLGLTVDSVKAVFLTHGHPDHIMGCPVFKNARIYAMEEDVAIIEGRESMGLMSNDGKVKITDSLKHGDKVNIDGTIIETFALPGHTHGSAAYIINGVVFMGDSANATNDNKMKQAIWFTSLDMDLNKASLKKLANFLKPRADKIKAIVFGHTGHLSGVEPLLEFADGE